MKTALMTAVVTALLAVSASALSAEPTAAEKDRCFKAHKALMHKPAVMNERDCWNAHKHLRKAE